MAVSSAYSSGRNDFRCAVCRQKNAFHCEHDTPYRDQYLGTYEYPSPNRKRRATEQQVNSQTRSHSNGQSHSANGYNRQHQEYNGQMSSKPTTTGSSKTSQPTKKSSSCAILWRVLMYSCRADEKFDFYLWVLRSFSSFSRTLKNRIYNEIISSVCVCVSLQCHRFEKKKGRRRRPGSINTLNSV